MNSAELALRRQRLQSRIAQQRVMIANGIEPLLPVLATLDGVGAALCWLRRNPLICAGALGLLAIVRPRFVFRWAKRGLFAWQTWQRVGRLLRK